jgi:hypothetical protein
MPFAYPRLRRLPGRTVLLAGIAAACAAVPPSRFADGMPRPVACPAASFFPRDGAVNAVVREGYPRIQLGHGHTLEFDEGAVPVGSTYRVSRAPGDFAALRIEPVGNAPMRFDGLARLTVNYAACGVDDGRPGFGLYRWDTGDTLVWVPSAPGGGRVSALLDGFSVYAIGSI